MALFFMVLSVKEMFELERKLKDDKFWLGSVDGTIWEKKKIHPKYKLEK